MDNFVGQDELQNKYSKDSLLFTMNFFGRGPKFYYGWKRVLAMTLHLSRSSYYVTGLRHYTRWRHLIEWHHDEYYKKQTYLFEHIHLLFPYQSIMQSAHLWQKCLLWLILQHDVISLQSSDNLDVFFVLLAALIYFVLELRYILFQGWRS